MSSSWFLEGESCQSQEHAPVMTMRFTRERGVGGVERGKERSPREDEKRDIMAAYSKHSWGVSTPV